MILGKPTRHKARLVACLMLTGFLSGCYIFNFLDGERAGGQQGATFSGTVAGQPLGDKAAGLDEAALAAVYAQLSDHAPAAIRPDPDFFVRRLLRQYRSEGSTVARQIGTVEQFRLLLGGATEDFSKSPQESYDATSLLAVFKVAEEVCRGLVAPNAFEHEGWVTILPYAETAERDNVQWLAQRIIGKPSAEIDATVIDQLLDIMAAEEPYLSEQWVSQSTYAKYIPVCATLALDAEALYL